MNVRVFSQEHRELKEVVDTQVKSPPKELKRRSTLQNITMIIPRDKIKKIEKDDIEEREKIV